MGMGTLIAWLNGEAALSACHSIADIRERARRRIPRFAFDYLDGGAEDEVALARSRASWTEIALTPRVGRDVSNQDTGIELFGRRWAAPLVSPRQGLLAWLGPGRT